MVSSRYSFCAGQLHRQLEISYGELLALSACVLHAYRATTKLSMLFQVLELWLHLKERKTDPGLKSPEEENKVGNPRTKDTARCAVCVAARVATPR